MARWRAARGRARALRQRRPRARLQSSPPVRLDQHQHQRVGRPPPWYPVLLRGARRCGGVRARHQLHAHPRPQARARAAIRLEFERLKPLRLRLAGSGRGRARVRPACAAAAWRAGARASPVFSALCDFTLARSPLFGALQNSAYTGLLAGLALRNQPCGFALRRGLDTFTRLAPWHTQSGRAPALRGAPPCELSASAAPLCQHACVCPLSSPPCKSFVPLITYVDPC